ncbi:MAG: hypothetical protein AAF135_26340 [Bacteroidota bacterium]
MNPSAILEASYGRTIFRLSLDVFKPEANLVQTNITGNGNPPSIPASLGFIQYGILVAL